MTRKFIAIDIRAQSVIQMRHEMAVAVTDSPKDQDGRHSAESMGSTQLSTRRHRIAQVIKQGRGGGGQQVARSWSARRPASIRCSVAHSRRGEEMAFWSGKKTRGGGVE